MISFFRMMIRSFYLQMVKWMKILKKMYLQMLD
uniref:Uncharacterized protein n=1 Tax=Siphoviridae sp. ctLqe90 TaxID=2825456 RepID=A0A8S5Q1T3_9CAUD|nr:MAG TPA: hypothetical protein [Siphoviridae sp. ctLqe90]